MINIQFDNFPNILKLYHSKSLLHTIDNPKAVDQRDFATTSLDHSPRIQASMQEPNIQIDMPTTTHIISPNINARIQNLLHDARQTQVNSSSTPLTQRLRSHTQRT